MAISKCKRVCRECGAEFVRTAKGQSTLYCPGCVVIPCEWCGEDMKRRNKGDQRACSRSCHSNLRALRGTHKDRAPEVEHIVSLADGGHHTWNNVACACRRCNIKKGAGSHKIKVNSIEKTTGYAGGLSRFSVFNP